MDERVGVEQDDHHAEHQRRHDRPAQERAQAVAPLDQPQEARYPHHGGHCPGRVLHVHGHGHGAPRQRPVPEPPALVDEQGGDERHGQRHQGHGVVQRLLRIEDGQEGAGHQRRRHEADAPLVEAGPGPVDEAHAERAEQRHGEARGGEHGGGIDPEGVPEAARAEREAGVEAQLEDAEQDVGEQRRVLEVLRVERAADHRYRARHEVLLLVGVVDVRQPVLERPDAQHERAQQDPEQRRPAREPQPARPAPHRRTPGAFPVVGVPVPRGTGPKPCLQLLSR